MCCFFKILIFFEVLNSVKAKVSSAKSFILSSSSLLSGGAKVLALSSLILTS